MAKKRDFKKWLELGDKFISASEKAKENLGGKSTKEIWDMLRQNAQGLRNPETFAALGKRLAGSNPSELKNFKQKMRENFSNLSDTDIANLTDALTRQEGMPEYINEKLKKADPKKPAPESQPTASEKPTDQPAEQPAEKPIAKKEEDKKEPARENEKSGSMAKNLGWSLGKKAAYSFLKKGKGDDGKNKPDGKTPPTPPKP